MGSGVPVFSLILAGGASARFWPCDGDGTPKYLLRPHGGPTLLELAFARAAALSGAANVFVVTGRGQADNVRKTLPSLAPANLIVEPARRDTLAAVALGMETIRLRSSGSALAVVTPADIHLDPADAFGAPFQEALAEGLFADNRLFCFGVAPTRPETGLGYLELGDPLSGRCFAARRFVEKPDAATAAGYVSSGRFLWNAGSFAWRLDAFFAELARQRGETAALVAKCAAATAAGDAKAAAAAFEAITPISVDYGVMEGASRVGVLRVECAFDDIGTWDALAAHGNFDAGQVLRVDSKNCVARGGSTDATIAFIGCEDLIVVQQGSRTLIVKAGSGQQVRKVRELEQPPRRARG